MASSTDATATPLPPANSKIRTSGVQDRQEHNSRKHFLLTSYRSSLSCEHGQQTYRLPNLSHDLSFAGPLPVANTRAQYVLTKDDEIVAAESWRGSSGKIERRLRKVVKG